MARNEIRRRFVSFLETACVWTHPIVHHRPWLWLRRMPVCPLAHLSGHLDEKWGTGVWNLPRRDET